MEQLWQNQRQNLRVLKAARPLIRFALAICAPTRFMLQPEIRKDVLAAIGDTPLIRLKAASELTGCEILGKAEFMNPGQSVKDRAALFIIRDAMAKGRLKPGGTVVEG